MKPGNYSKTPEANGFRFDVTPAPRSLGGCAGILFMLLIALSAGLLTGVSVSQSFGLIIFTGLAAFLLFKFDIRKKNHKKPSSFFVNNTEVAINGLTFSKEEIHRIIIKNAFDTTPRIQMTGQRNTSTGAALGHDLRNSIEQISFSVNLEAAGKSTQLAGGLDETTAFGLLTEVGRILEMENR